MNPVLLSLTAALCWALSGLFYKKSLEEVGAFTAVLHRTSVATLLFFFASLGKLDEILHLDLISIVVLVASALFAFVIGDVLYFKSLEALPLSVAFPVASTYPVFVVLLASLNEGLNSSALVSSILVTSAVFAVYWRGGELKNVHLALGAAISWSLAVASLDYLTKLLSTETLAFYRMLMAVPFLAYFANGVEVKSIRSFFFAGLLGGTLSFAGIYLFIDSVRISSSQLVVSPSASSPVIAALLGKFALKEELDARIVVAVALIVVSILLLLLPLSPRSTSS